MNEDDHYAGVLTGLIVLAAVLLWAHLKFFGLLE